MNQTCPISSFRDTFDQDPFAFYRELRESGGIAWDDRLGVWLVADYEACMHIFRNDDKLFRNPHVDQAEEDPTIYAIEGGSRGINFLHGDEHDRYHRWYTRVLSTRTVDRLRSSVIVPVSTATLDRFRTRGSADLVSEYAEKIPIRVIAAVMDLPWQDDAWIDHYKQLTFQKMEYYQAAEGERDGEVREKALSASAEIKEFLRPYVESRESGTGDDLISWLWRDGHTILPDWGVDDVLGAAELAFFAAGDTTYHSIVNGLHLLLTSPPLADAFRGGDQEIRVRATEEIMRLHGAVHYRERIANVDVQLKDVSIKEGEMCYVLVCSANHDHAHYEDADAVLLTRPRPREHLAFGFGSRICGGIHLARAEVEEAVRTIAISLDNLRLDSDAELPEYYGSLLRSVRTLPVRFDV